MGHYGVGAEELEADFSATRASDQCLFSNTFLEKHFG